MGSSQSVHRGRAIAAKDFRWIGSSSAIYIENCWSNQWNSVIDRLAQLSHLRNLSLNCSEVLPNVLESIGQQMPLLQQFSFKRNKCNAAGVASLRNLQQLRVLNLDYTLDGQDITPIGTLRILTELSLNLTFEVSELTGIKNATIIEKLSNITHLSIRSISRDSEGHFISDEGASRIAGLTGLVELNVGNCNLTERGVKTLAKCCNLTILRIPSNKLAGDGATALAKQFALLTCLNIRGNFIGDQGLKMLAILPRLRELDAISNQIGPLGLPHVAKFQALSNLAVGKNHPLDRSSNQLLRALKLSSFG